MHEKLPNNVIYKPPGEGMNLRLSRFCHFLSDDCTTVAINTLFRSVVELDKVAVAALKGLKLKSLPHEDISVLKDAHILVGSNIDELSLFHDWIHRVRRDMQSICATIVVSNRCNLKCAYCFEKGYVQNTSIDLNEQIVQDIANWLNALARNHDSHDLTVHYYGGEPTLRPDLIYLLWEQLKSLSCELGLKVKHKLYTNGTLIPDVLLSLMKGEERWGLQVTLDGPPDVHDRRRSFKNGAGTFGVIIHNLKRVFKETLAQVTVLVNFDNQNYKAIPELLDILGTEGIADHVELAFNPVFQTPFNQAHCSRYTLVDDDTYQVWRWLNQTATQKGLKCDSTRIFNKGPCSFHRKGNLFFDPQGSIYKCIGVVGVDELCVGSVREEPSKVIERIEEQMSILPWDNPECLDCPYLPLCLGGCRFHSYVDSGDFHRPFCHKKLIENVDMRSVFEMATNERM